VLKHGVLHVKKRGCPARPSSVAELLRRAKKSGVLHSKDGYGGL
jgi:hypothetical protein